MNDIKDLENKIENIRKFELNYIEYLKTSQIIKWEIGSTEYRHETEESLIYRKYINENISIIIEYAIECEVQYIFNVINISYMARIDILSNILNIEKHAIKPIQVFDVLQAMTGIYKRRHEHIKSGVFKYYVKKHTASFLVKIINVYVPIKDFLKKWIKILFNPVVAIAGLAMRFFK